MSNDVSKAEVLEHGQCKTSRGSLEKMSILMSSFKAVDDGKISKEGCSNVSSSVLSESLKLPPFRAPPAPPLCSVFPNDTTLEQVEDFSVKNMAQLDTVRENVDSSKQEKPEAKSKATKVTRAPEGFRPEQQTLEAGHQVVVLRDTHTREGKAYHAGEVMAFEKEGKNGWTYVRDVKGAFCWLPSDALQAAGAGEADGGEMQILPPSNAVDSSQQQEREVARSRVLSKVMARATRRKNQQISMAGVSNAPPLAPSSNAGDGKDGLEPKHESELMISSDSGLSTALIPAVRAHCCI
jgi:hypothetical protein